MKTLVKWELENDIVKEAIFALKSSQPEWKDFKKIKGKNYFVKNTELSVVLILLGSKQADCEGFFSICNEGF